MQCPQCAHTNRATSRFCVRCGASIPAAIVGKVLQGRYRIQRSLAKGGMGAIYLASDTIAGQERKLVIKEMLVYYETNDPQAEERARKRFETEAATLVSLSGIAGVPQIFEYFTEDGRHYIVMQFIEGDNLETGLTHEDEQGNWVKGRAYPETQIRQWGVKVCKILEVLAAKSIVHMDIKPANLILDKYGDIWLVDFGTVKAQLFSPPGGGSVGKKPSIYGTAGYAPPEQVKGKAEPRSDVYALAATLYHLATDDDPGSQPFQFPRLNSLSSESAKALRSALEADVSKRISAAALRLMLETPGSSKPVFRWQDGTVSSNPKDLAMTANRKWEEALGYFQADDWVKWLRDQYKNDLASELLAIRKKFAHPELALDAFLRRLEPALPPAKLQLDAPILDAGMVPWQAKREVVMKVFNRGSGCLQARCVRLAPGIQVEPSDFTVHEERAVKVSLNAEAMTPSAVRQTHHLDIEAGAAGKERVTISALVPEPKLAVNCAVLDLGSVHRGEVLTRQLGVQNQGKSPFLGEARCIAPWATVKPAKFVCREGGSNQVKVEVHTHGLKMEAHTALVDIWARAGGWEQIEKVRLNLRVSLVKTAAHILGPPLKWAGGWSLYGVCMGAALGTGLAGAVEQYVEASTWILLAAFFGAVISALPGMLIGWFGGVGEMRGREGAGRLAAYGALAGAILGGVSGALLQSMLVNATKGLGPAIGFPLFSSLVGWAVGLSLGAFTWLLPKK